MDGYWLPSEPDVLKLEAKLPGYLSELAQRAPSARLEEFTRQYVGVVSNGRRLIYGSFLHNSEGIDSSDQSWRTEAVIVCDGGDWFWGISFDPETQTFDQPQYNGEA